MQFLKHVCQSKQGKQMMQAVQHKLQHTGRPLGCCLSIGYIQTAASYGVQLARKQMQWQEGRHGQRAAFKERSPVKRMLNMHALQLHSIA